MSDYIFSRRLLSSIIKEPISGSHGTQAAILKYMNQRLSFLMTVTNSFFQHLIIQCQLLKPLRYQLQHGGCTKSPFHLALLWGRGNEQTAKKYPWIVYKSSLHMSRAPCKAELGLISRFHLDVLHNNGSLYRSQTCWVVIFDHAKRAFFSMNNVWNGPYH